MAEVTRTVKIGACIGLDLLDFTIGRVPGVGLGFDIGLAIVAAAMWGKRGWWHLWEVADVTEQFCAFVPTCTLIALNAASAERAEERQLQQLRLLQLAERATLKLPSA